MKGDSFKADEAIYKKIRKRMIDLDHASYREMANEIGCSYSHIDLTVRGLSTNPNTRAQIERILGEKFWE